MRRRNSVLGKTLSAFAPAAALAVGTAPRRRRPPSPALEPLSFVVYTLGDQGMAREARPPLDEFLERGRELQAMGTTGARYGTLRRVFGDPLPASDLWDDEKSQVVWIVQFSDGTWATIYDYQADTAPENVTQWSVGAFTQDALDHVQSAIASAGNLTMVLNPDYRVVHPLEKALGPTVGFLSPVAYGALAEAFGEPLVFPELDEEEPRVQVLWRIRWSDGAENEIYDYKMGPAWQGPEGKAPPAITDWDVSGDRRGYQRLVQMFEVEGRPLARVANPRTRPDLGRARRPNVSRLKRRLCR